MNLLPEFPAIVYLWNVFRHSPDIISTFLGLTPAEQGYIVLLCVVILNRFRK